METTMHKFYLKIIALYVTLASVSTAFAQDFDKCLAAPDLVQKLALYGIPIFVLVVAGMVISKMWASAAVRNGIPSSSHATAGWALGLFLSSLSFAGMLFATSVPVDINNDRIVDAASCYPTGWEIIAGILVVVTLAVFGITKANAK
jgi:hypothetical protein